MGVAAGRDTDFGGGGAGGRGNRAAGGLVGFEGSMVALLRQAGLGAPEAALATLLTRLATLWFAVLIGLLAWLWISRPEPPRRVPTRIRK